MTLNPDTIQVLPVLALKTSVLFPGLVVPLSAGRPSSIAAVEEALAGEDKAVAVVAQRDPMINKIGGDDLYTVGTLGIIQNSSRAEKGVELLVQGNTRLSIMKLEQTEPFLKARVRALPFSEEQGTEVEALHRVILEMAGRLLELVQPQTPIPLAQIAAQAGDPLRLAFIIGSFLGLDTAKQQALLEATSTVDALRLLYGYLAHEVQVAELRQKITKHAETEMTQQQREYYLRQQLQAIQEELGEKNPEKSEVEELRKRLADACLPDDIRKEAERELGRLSRLPALAPDFQIIRTYLDLLLELPWQKATEDQLELDRAEQVLDEDHFGLADIKERIIEHLAVLKLNPKAKAPILCLVGPPGVGKTSLGQSIARALGRKFERMSLGGLHDESELRGHRRTYIGAMPGRILQALRRAGVSNPLLMLDEVDKLGQDFRGDPAAALLEILDPAQNNTFRDNYLDLPFDLSKVMFITTANTLDTVPRPLLDRMEILRMSGYSEEEKIQIARRYLLPRRLSEGGLTPEQMSVPDETLRSIVGRYTREAGVRELERCLGRLTRKVARRFAQGDTTPATIGPEDVSLYLGPERFRPEQARRHQTAGVATGMAWTEAGGEVLYVEASVLPDGRGVRLTGHLGDVMRESARAAQAYIWSHADQLGIDPALFHTTGIHIHVPAGAVPKDGPSAGVAMVAALASAYSHMPARNDTSMTGEITLSGWVLPVGGIKEKILAARRAGIRRIILPRDNEKDLVELPKEIRQEIEFVLVERIEQVLSAAIPGLTLRPLNGLLAG